VTRHAAWLTLGLLACSNGKSEPSAIPPAPNATTAVDLPATPAPVPAVTGPKDFTLVYTHNLDGEIEPCG